jgi:thiosulfate/3-mercaptopyruvate sulfurtransferase
MLPPLVSPEVLRQTLDNDRARVFDATVFLVRDAENGPYTIAPGRDQYEQAHLPGASFADISGELSDPASPFPFTVPSAEHFANAAGRLGIGDNHHVVAYSQGSPMWATRLWWLLRYFGHDGASVLDGGLPAWIASGGAVEEGTRAYPRTSFSARPRRELLASLDDVKAIVEGAPAQLVNALPRTAFLGEGPGAYSRPGRIPGSISLPWSELVDPKSNRFVSTETMASTFREATLSRDEPVVAYCGGGISATVDVFALYLAGWEPARLYDGSLTEWSAGPDLPLVTG